MAKKATISLSDVIKEIREGNVSPVYLIHGDEEYLVTESSNKIIEELCKGTDDLLNKEVLDGKTVSAKDIVTSLQTLPFFGNQKVVVVKEWKFLQAPSTQDKPVVSDLIQKGIPEGTVLVVVNSKIKKTSDLYKYIAAHGKILEYGAFVKQNRQTLSALYGLALKKLIASNKMISRQSFEHLINYTGLNVRQIMDELEKLIVFSGDTKKEIGKDDIDLLIPRSSEAVMFRLADTIGEKNLKNSLQLLSDLFAQNENPIGIILTISNRVRLLLQLLSLFEFDLDNKLQSLRFYNEPVIDKWLENIPDLLKERFPYGKSVNVLKQHPYRLYILARQSGNFRLNEIVRIYDKITNTYLQLVSSSKDKKILLELLVMEICGGKEKEEGRGTTASLGRKTK